MVHVRQALLAAAALLLAPLAPARADAFAQAILAIDNFRLLNASGNAIAGSQFALTAGMNSGAASAALDGQVRADTVALGLGSALDPDVAQQFVGISMPALENSFSPTNPGLNVRGTFGYADQQLAGGMLGRPRDGSSGTSRLQSMAALESQGKAGGAAGGTTIAAFDFTLGVGDFMTLAFDATPFTQAYVKADAGAASQAEARLSWRVDIMNLSTGQLVFAYQPGELNNQGSVSRNDSFAGMTVYNPGMLSFSAQTPFLNNTDRYQMVIQHSTLANALQASMNVAAPDSLALSGLALLALALARSWRHRRRHFRE